MLGAKFAELEQVETLGLVFGVGVEQLEKRVGVERRLEECPSSARDGGKRGVGRRYRNPGDGKRQER